MTMTDPFDAALAFTLAQEGDYANLPGDTGGETFRGIARNHHPLWLGWKILDAMPAKQPPWPKELDAEVRLFYRMEFWDRIGGDQLPPLTAMSLFDYAVHSGVVRALQVLQRLVGDAPDGVFGPKTLAAATKWMDRQLASELVTMRSRWLLSWAGDKSHPERQAWVHGYENRLRALSEQLA